MGQAYAVAQRGIESVPDSRLLPLGKVVIDQSPFGKVMRQISPGTSTACDVEDRIEHQPPLVAGRTAQLAFDRQQWPHDLPFDICQVARVGFDFRHPKPSTPPSLLVQASFSSEAYFLNSLLGAEFR